MKKSFGLLIIGVVGLTACTKSGIASGTPKCVENKIIDFKDKAVCEEGTKVELYSFQGEDVYVFVEGNCGADLTSEVIDSDCNSLGYLGGITGNNEINGENFDDAIYKKIIWQQ